MFRSFPSLLFLLGVTFKCNEFAHEVLVHSTLQAFRSRLRTVGRDPVVHQHAKIVAVREDQAVAEAELGVRVRKVGLEGFDGVRRGSTIW